MRLGVEGADLDDATARARDYITTMRYAAPDSLDIEVISETGAKVPDGTASVAGRFGG